MGSPSEILESALCRALASGSNALIHDREIAEKVTAVCECASNRAGIRLLMSCMLAKIADSAVDPREPYTEIGSDTCFSGRGYDEQYVGRFIAEQRLPCNSTTAFLTPAFRNIERALTKDVQIIGRPRQMYIDLLAILDDVAQGRVEASDVLADTIHILLLQKASNAERLDTLLQGATSSHSGALSGEEIVRLFAQHLACKNASRLPVLIVAAAYEAAGERIGELARPLQSHNAADKQTGALGDVEVCLVTDDDVVTSYEMKMKRVTLDDIECAIQKIVDKTPRVQHYVFITTEPVLEEVREFANGMYDKTGTEVAILDCIEFLRHFVHFFYRLRMEFLNAYQKLLLSEPASAVRQSLKEAFLTLRKVAESAE